jgi:hypothetical protein
MAATITYNSTKSIWDLWKSRSVHRERGNDCEIEFQNIETRVLPLINMFWKFGQMIKKQLFPLEQNSVFWRSGILSRDPLSLQTQELHSLGVLWNNQWINKHLNIYWFENWINFLNWQTGNLNDKVYLISTKIVFWFWLNRGFWGDKAHEWNQSWSNSYFWLNNSFTEYI